MNPTKNFCNHIRNEQYNKSLPKNFPLWKVGNNRFPHFNHPISAVDTAFFYFNLKFLRIIMS